MATKDTIAEAIRDTLISPNVSDSNFESANVVDVLNQCADAIYYGLRADTGAKHKSLADAVLLSGDRIASALCEIARAIRETNR